MSAAKLGLTVGELRAALVALVEVPDDAEVVVRVDGENSYFAGGILSASVETSCDDDAPFLALDCSDDDEDLSLARADCVLGRRETN